MDARDVACEGFLGCSFAAQLALGEIQTERGEAAGREQLASVARDTHAARFGWPNARRKPHRVRR
jgi:hypothetical protein